ncbi:MAG TPA: 23S rRNA (guanosine(2251)-2'-O)-methyltransferase RlmB [Solirubrobacteraceae bacterium]|nr:23S rRNA (guanosine(2251)-2'-O)-methyltransferase RlmB [Solirubrobacteraceae bacterium]
MFVYGRNPVHEAIRGPRTVSRVWATSGAAREPWLAGRVELATGEEIAGRCGSEAHQGICAEVSAYRYHDPQALLRLPEPLIVVLDQVQDPQNLGSICRSAECAGASGVVLPERRSAEVTPAVCKASAGAVEHLPVAIVRNLADFLADAKGAGLWCYGADAAATVAYDQVDYTGGAVLVLGSEGRGLRPRVAAACDALVALPLRGQIESLSVGAAAAVLLYAASSSRAKASSA